jgi:hypothetical protein
MFNRIVVIPNPSKPSGAGLEVVSVMLKVFLNVLMTNLVDFKTNAN